MMSVVRRIVVSTALGGALIYAGVTGLSPASAQTNTPTPKATATTKPSTKAPAATKHNCPNDKAGSSSSGSTSTSTTSFSSL